MLSEPFGAKANLDKTAGNPVRGANRLMEANWPGSCCWAISRSAFTANSLQGRGELPPGDAPDSRQMPARILVRGRIQRLRRWKNENRDERSG